MVLDPNNDRGHQIDVIPEKGQEYQAVRIFGKDTPSPDLRWVDPGWANGGCEGAPNFG